jgi:hypothetical protein
MELCVIGAYSSHARLKTGYRRISLRNPPVGTPKRGTPYPSPGFVANKSKHEGYIGKISKTRSFTETKHPSGFSAEKSPVIE